MGLFDRLRGGLVRTREVLNTPIEDLVRGRRPLDEAALDAVEEALLAADMGLPAVDQAMQVLRERSGQIAPGGLEAMRDALRDELRRALERPAGATPFSVKPWVVFMVGVNGAGKTTTIGKLAATWRDEGRSRAAVRGRHLPRRGGRAARGLGAAGRRRVPPRRRGRRSRRPCSPTRCARPARGGSTRCSSTPPGACTRRRT